MELCAECRVQWGKGNGEEGKKEGKKEPDKRGKREGDYDRVVFMRRVLCSMFCCVMSESLLLKNEGRRRTSQTPLLLPSPSVSPCVSPERRCQGQ
jgi:hypothetical protein